jgi:ABC-type uncharacterized transport system YnjBCD permease subunit
MYWDAREYGNGDEWEWIPDSVDDIDDQTRAAVVAFSLAAIVALAVAAFVALRLIRRPAAYG